MKKGSDNLKYECINMGAYNLHLINTKRFKTVTVEVNFRRIIKKDEITKRTLLKDILLNSSNRYQTERELIIASEDLYDLKLIASSARMGNYTNLSFKIKYLNAEFSEKNMNEKCISFLMDILFNPNIDENGFKESVVDKCSKRLAKSIKSLKDNKIKYSLWKLLESIPDKPYSYNSYGYIEDLETINGKNLFDYYNSIINDDLIDIFVVGDFDSDKIKDIIKNTFNAKTFHKEKNDIIVKELEVAKKVNKIIENDNVNQSQLTMLCSMNNVSDYERKYVSSIYNEILGGSSSSMLFDNVREKNSYAYYINSNQKSYDNILLIYSGIEPGNSETVIKLIKKVLLDMQKGRITNEQIKSAKETIISAIKASLDNPSGIINTYYAKVLVNSDDVETRIKKINEVSKDSIVSFANKITLHTIYLLEGDNNAKN